MGPDLLPYESKVISRRSVSVYVLFVCVRVLMCMHVCVCVCVCVSSVWQKLCEYARKVTDLLPTSLAFRRLKTWFLLRLQV